jgi:squalene-associated FAD-dependent desaturase
VTVRAGHPVVIVGAGVAGIAAAVSLARAGVPVEVLETRRKLGGRATSFEDPRDGMELDNCQHVLMGCCTALLELYAMLGVSDAIEWHPTVWWANPPHDPDVMRPGWLPAPAHYTGSFLRMRMLGVADKRAVARAMLALIRMGRRGRGAWAGRAFSDFLVQTRQTPRAVERFWEPVIVSACNGACTEVDASYAMKVFQDGFLQDSWSPVMGLSRLPLARLYDPALQIIESSGGRVRTGVSVQALAFDGSRISGVVTDEGLVDASAVISALPPDRLDRICSDTLRAADARLRSLGEIRFAPILGVHLFFGQPVMRTPHLVLPGRPTQWLFGKGTDELGRHHVHAVISAAQDWMSLDEAEIGSRVMRDVHWGIPSSQGIEPLAVRAVKEKRATFACAPGIDAFRPGAAPDAVRGGVRNLFLAGDWCATGWPATMEGAARSGFSAARAALASAPGVPAPDGAAAKVPTIADVPAAPLARMLGLREA